MDEEEYSMNPNTKKDIQNFLAFYNNRRLYADQNDDLLTIDDYNVFLYTAINFLEKCVKENE
jgi:hypothetical protein